MNWSWRDGVAALLIGCGMALVLTAAGGCSTDGPPCIDEHCEEQARELWDRTPMDVDEYLAALEEIGLIEDEEPYQPNYDAKGLDWYPLFPLQLLLEDPPANCGVTTWGGQTCYNPTNPSFCKTCGSGQCIQNTANSELAGCWACTNAAGYAGGNAATCANQGRTGDFTPCAGGPYCTKCACPLNSEGTARVCNNYDPRGQPWDPIAQACGGP